MKKEQDKSKEGLQFEINEQEKAMLKAQRAASERIQSCTKGIEEILDKYKCIVQIDPRSPFGNPQVVVVPE